MLAKFRAWREKRKQFLHEAVQLNQSYFLSPDMFYWWEDFCHRHRVKGCDPCFEEYREKYDDLHKTYKMPLPWEKNRNNN